MQGKGAAFGLVQQKDSSDEEQKEPNRLDEIFKPNKKVYEQPAEWTKGHCKTNHS
jgi:hypothetical protein